ncbi:MAG: hypothetical protein K9H58_08235 [Bacteroidales bacterium]|nr:hypothetical protein [Bacteroidales bacterium]
MNNKLKRKQVLLGFIGMVFSLSLLAQSITPEAIVSSGGYFEDANNSISYSLGELATQTYSNGALILTEGFQQTFSSLIISGIDLNLFVYLEGPFTGTTMNTFLTGEAAEGFPLSQPYNIPPWNYNGSESIVSIPNPEIVDWVLIELRDATSPGTALPSATIARQAAFLLNDGSVVGIDGESMLQFENSPNLQLYVIVWHRNHLGIMSANGVSQSNGVYSYDFSSAITQVYNAGAGYKEITSNVFGMVGGDANRDGIINLNDKAFWTNQSGTKGYKFSDFNMDIQTNNKDKNDI